MIIVALGANLPGPLGDPAQTLAAAIDALRARGLTVTRESRIWLTAPVPVSDQPDYHNAVVAVETDLEPLALLRLLQGIEKDFGRVRTIRNAPRILDLDLIAYHDEVIRAGEDLITPHPRMYARGFVLLPLRDIDPDWVHPVLRAKLSSLIERLPPDQAARPL